MAEALGRQDKQGHLPIFFMASHQQAAVSLWLFSPPMCDYFSYKILQYRDSMVTQMLFYKPSAELNGLPHCSMANDDNKSYMHILSLLSSFFLVIFRAKIEYQKESKIFSTHKASGFKASIRNMETVKLVFVLLSSNTAPVSHGRMVEERSEFHGEELERVTSLSLFCIAVITRHCISLL